MTTYCLGNDKPDLPPQGGYWIAPDAAVIGKVTLSEAVSIWFGAVLRGDNEPISIGWGSNVQEQCVLHTDPGFPLVVGKNCTVGHGAVLHGCSIADGALIGMSATVLNGARVGRDCIVGAGALVTEGKSFPDGVLIVGSPGRVIRELRSDEIEASRKNAAHYQQAVSRYLRDLKQCDK